MTTHENESRVLWLLGFYHCKEEPVLVECVHFRPELRYTQAELEQYLPQVPEEGAASVAATVKGSQNGLMLVERRCDFIQHCRDNAATLSEYDWYAMITNLAVFEGGDQAVHKLSATYPKYRAAETQDKINHFLRFGTKPMTCKTIAEKGFVYPKIAGGECGYNVPAAMCFKALAVEEFREMLFALLVGGSAVENMAVAATFIEYELRQHFDMKAAGIKPLAAYHRKLYREYRQYRKPSARPKGPTCRTGTSRRSAAASGSFPVCWRTIWWRMSTPSMARAAISVMKGACTKTAAICGRRQRCGSLCFRVIPPCRTLTIQRASGKC